MGNSLKLGTGKADGRRRGGKRPHCIGRTLNCQAKERALDLALDRGDSLRAFEWPRGPVCAETDREHPAGEDCLQP